MDQRTCAVTSTYDVSRDEDELDIVPRSGASGELEEIDEILRADVKKSRALGRLLDWIRGRSD